VYTTFESGNVSVLHVYEKHSGNEVDVGGLRHTSRDRPHDVIAYADSQQPLYNSQSSSSSSSASSYTVTNYSYIDRYFAASFPYFNETAFRIRSCTQIYGIMKPGPTLQSIRGYTDIFYSAVIRVIVIIAADVISVTSPACLKERSQRIN